MVVFVYQCVRVCVLHVYLSGAVPLIFHWRVEQLIGDSVSQSFILIYLRVFFVFGFCVCVLCVQLKFLCHALIFLQQDLLDYRSVRLVTSKTLWCLFVSVTLRCFTCLSHKPQATSHNVSLHVTYFLSTACYCFFYWPCDKCSTFG